ncbi:MAG: ABC transporter substrate-binding protein [Pseudomonadota bacterium]
MRRAHCFELSANRSPATRASGRALLRSWRPLAAALPVLAAGLVALAGAGAALASEPASRILSIGGAVTEIVYALEQEHRLIARDTTSTFPSEAEDLPDVGYMRALSPEGVLSVEPDLIISAEGAGPPETIEVLDAASIPFVTVPEGYTADAVVEKINVVGEALEVPDAAGALASEVAAKLQAAASAAEAAASGSDEKSVLFILSTQGGRVMASGTGTAADGIIRLAGAQNAVSEFEGYKQMSDEAVAALAPDVILMMDRGGNHGAADEELFAMPALVTTPAAQDRAVVRMNGLTLLGFGPRTADAVTALSDALYGGS